MPDVIGLVLRCVPVVCGDTGYGDMRPGDVSIALHHRQGSSLWRAVKTDLGA